MKKTALALFINIIALSLSGCSDDNELFVMDNSSKNNESCDQNSLTRSSLTLESDWEKMEYVTRPNGKNEMLPWYIRANSPVDHTVLSDMKKEDGWVLLSHSLYEPDFSKAPIDYIALYNQATGDLKVYINSDKSLSEHNTALWNIYFTKPQAWINSLNEITLPSSYQFKSTFRWRTSVAPIDNKSYLEQGWNVVIIPNLSYDPNSPNDIGIKIGSESYTQSIVDLIGETDGEINGKIIATGSNNSLSGLENSIVTYTGKSAEKWAKKILNVSEDNNTRSIVGLLATGVGALVKAGAGKILNSFFGKFSKPTYSEQNVRLNLQASTTIKGNVVKPMSTGLATTGFDIGKDVTGVELGAWNLRENPIIYMHPVGVINNSFNGIQTDEAQYRFTASGKSKVDLVINPQLMPHIIAYEVECVPVSYSTNNNASKLPQIPVSDYQYTDFGSLGAEESISSFRPSAPANSTIYTGEDFSISDSKAQGLSTFWNFWRKYGKYSPQMPMYKYVYAPDNTDLCRGGAIKVGCKYNFAKVMVTMVTEFEGKRDTIVTSRTYKPRFEWDPDQVNRYKGVKMSTLQGYASSDPVLSSIDNGYYSKLQRESSPYNVVRNDSVALKKK